MMSFKTFVNEDAAARLKTELLHLNKTDYDTIDRLMTKIAKHHEITPKQLHNKFVNKYNKTPDDWIKGKK